MTVRIGTAQPALALNGADIVFAPTLGGAALHWELQW